MIIIKLVSFVLVVACGHACDSIALCFFGLTRALKTHSYVSIQRYLISPLLHQGYHVDVFLHTYNMSTITNPRSKEYNVSLDPHEWRLLEPFASLVDDPGAADERYNARFYGQFGNPWERSPPIVSYSELK